MSFSAPYYFPNLTRESAEEILREKESGSYLLRKSSKQNQYALSIAHHNNIIHSLICWNTNTNLYYLEDGQTPECETPIAVCQYLIDNQESQLFYPVESMQFLAEESNLSTFGSDSNCADEKIDCAWESDFADATSSEDEATVAFSRQCSNQTLTYQSEPRRLVDVKDVKLTEKCDYENCGWFHGQISREEAFRRLSKNFKKHSLNGIFLVRSKSTSDFVLDLISQGVHFKYEIVRNSQTKMFEMQNSVLKKSSLKELIDCLQKGSSDVTGIVCQLESPCPKFKETKKIKNYLRPSFVKHKKLKLKEVIGKGNFGEVRKGSWKRGPNDSVDVAVKILKPKQKNLQTDNNDELRKEAKIMKGLDHLNIVKILGIHDGEHGLRLLLEYMERGSLVNYLRANATCGLSGRKILKIVLEIAYGMIYLADNKIVHRDLAARNVLLDTNLCAKIADFGMARITKEGMYVQYDPKEGPLKWYAPECLEHAEYTTKSDVWSFGVTMWETFSYGEEPYKGNSNNVILQIIKNGYRLEQPKDCRNEIYLNMKKCWLREPTERPDFSTLYSNLHKIFGENYSN